MVAVIAFFAACLTAVAGGTITLTALGMDPGFVRTVGGLGVLAGMAVGLSLARASATVQRLLRERE